MGHLIFLLLHVGALLMMPLLLVVTIPLHLIFGAVAGGGSEPSPNRWTHVRCPECQELVLKGARLCKHCQTKLAPP